MTATHARPHHLQSGQLDDFSVRNLSQIAAARESSSQAMAALLAMVASLSLLVGGIGIMNILLSVTGGVAGIGFGLLTSLVIARLAQWPTQVSLTAVLGGFAFSAAVGMLLGFYPARKAANLNPIEALHYE